MTEIEETIVMYKQLCKEHTLLSNKEFNLDDFFELKTLQLEILKCEGKLRSLGVDF